MPHDSKTDSSITCRPKPFRAAPSCRSIKSTREHVDSYFMITPILEMERERERKMEIPTYVYIFYIVVYMEKERKKKKKENKKNKKKESTYDVCPEHCTDNVYAYGLGRNSLNLRAVAVDLYLSFTCREHP
jgi:hypothetical protein